MPAFWKGALAAAALVAPVAYAASINPSPVHVNVAEGQTQTVQREVVLDGLGPAASRIDVYFLADNTGSMGGTIYTVRNNAQTILDAISGTDPRFENIDIAYGVASYNGDPREFGGDESYKIGRAIRLLQPITESKPDTQSAINQWRASGGGDGPEANFFALHQLATNGGPTDGEGSTDTVFESGYEFGWRDNAVKLIVWFGDYRSHTSTVSRQEVIDALVDNDVVVAAINTRSSSSGINSGGEAAAIVEATNGYIAHNIRGSDETIDAILNSVERATESVDLSLASNNVPDGIEVTYSCVSPEGCEDVAVGESRLFDMHVTGVTPGTYDFETYVPFLNDVRSQDSATVRQCLRNMEARGSRSKISVVWDDSGADHYNVYRATEESGPFTLLASTTNRYSTYGDRDVEPGTTYYYQVREADASNNEYCSSVVQSTQTARRFRAGDPNQSPSIESSPIVSVDEDALYQYTISATDPEGAELRYTLSEAPLGMTVDVSGVVQWMPENRDVGPHSIVITVSDEEGLSDTQVYTLTVNNTNDAPEFSSTPLTEVRVGESYSYAAQARDVDAGDSLTYELLEAPAGMTVDPALGLLTWMPQYGDGPSQVIRLQAQDEEGATAVQEFELIVTEPNRAPVITSTPVTEVEAGTYYDYSVEASDPDAGDNVSFSLLTGPEAMSINENTGYLAWSPDNTQVGMHTVSIQVVDGGGLSDVQTFELNVTGDGPIDNNPPEITSEPPGQVQVGNLYTYTVVAMDSDGDEITFSLTDAPDGMTLDGVSGELNWTPTTTQVGTHSVSIQAMDARGAGVMQQYEVQVLPLGNSAPAIESTPSTSVEANSLYQYAVSATDPDGDALTFELDEAPSGMTIDAGGLIEWTPSSSDVGTQSIVIRVTDDQGAWVAQSYTLTVLSDNGSPEITSTPVTEVIVGETYSYDVDAVEPDGESLTYSLMAWPGGMSINADSGLIEWTPAVSQVGNNNVQVRVVDESGFSDTQAFSISVSTGDIDPPYLSNTPTHTAVVGQAYSYRVWALDAYGYTPNVSLVSGPAGMTLDNSGSGLPELKWTPEEGDCIKSVTLRLADAYGQEVDVDFDIHVLAAPKRLNRIQCSKQDESCGE